MVPVIVNASAGSACAEALDSLREAFGAVGLEVEIVQVPHGQDLRQVARTLVDRKPPAVIAGGGDGTINAVASALVDTDIPLGVLPLGTLNHFAKDLQIPLEVADAARVIAEGHVTQVDLGEVNGQIFINNSSLGLYPNIVRDREQQRRRLGRGKWPALIWATLTALRRSPFLSLRLCLNDVYEQFTTSFVFIGNNVYTMEGFNIGARERLSAGCLSVYLTRRRSRARLVMLALRALIGRLYQADDFEATTAASLRVESRHRRLYVATDGEVVTMLPPLEYRIRPAALRVFVPRPAEGIV